MSYVGVSHGSDTNYIFNGVFPEGEIAQEDLDLSEMLTRSLINFAYTGDPDSQSSSEWPEAFEKVDSRRDMKPSSVKIQVIGGTLGTGSVDLTDYEDGEAPDISGITGHEEYETGFGDYLNLEKMQQIVSDVFRFRAMDSSTSSVRKQKIQHEDLFRRCEFVDSLAETLGLSNASSLPLRVPFLSDVLKQLHKSPPAPTHAPVKYTLAALSYRGFWTSKGRATQPGIELDAAAALEWVNRTYNPIDNTGEDVRVVMWGQSIGAGVATTTTAQYLRRPHEASSSASSNPGSVLQAKSPARKANFDISALILETPFTSIRSMLVALYPQKWLPYRYLWPFLRSWWDSERALREIAAVSCDSDPKRSHHKKPTVLILQAGRDEIVPPEQGPGLESLCQTLGLDVERVVVGGALHTEVLARREGRDGVCGVLRRVGEAAEQEEE
ncbi:MAG: hypothetical protein M1819_000714 [Sarea resinae]|nr:MAG: hypothetical protein M1819_000714 [Sarea resinae]